MRRLFCVFILTSAVSQAASVYTSCTAGNTTLSPCNSDFYLLRGGLSGPEYVSRAYAAVSGPVFTGASAEVSAVANAIAQNLGPPMAISANAQASDTVDFSAPGPVRPGFIQLNVNLSYLHADVFGSTGVTISDGTVDYQFIGGGGIHGPVAPVQCNPEDCIYTATLPFDLGSTFQASVASQVAGFFKGSYSEADVTFALFEADGSTPAPFFAAPEPSTGTFVLIGAAIVAYIACRRPAHRVN